jgi:hypothetical protein
MAGTTALTTGGGPSWWQRNGRRLSGGFILAGALAVGWFLKGATPPDATGVGEVAPAAATTVAAPAPPARSPARSVPRLGDDIWSRTRSL